MGPRIGLYFDLRNPPPWRRPFPRVYDRALELSSEADRRGIGGIWLSEHHFFEDGYLPQPLIFAAAVAARTRSARIGTAIVLPALRSPLHLAEEAAVVDIVSNGRLELGLGAGYRVPEFQAFGADHSARYRTTEASVRELRDLWADRVSPRPVQMEPPLWLGYKTARGAARAGNLGVGLLSLERQAMAGYLVGLREAGFEPGTARIAGPLHMVLAHDPEAVWPRIRPHVSWQWDTYNKYAVEGTGKGVPPPVDPDRGRCGGSTRRPLVDVVTPDDAIRHIESVVAGYPVTDVFLWADIAGMPDDLVQQNVDLVCDRLVPHFRECEP